MYYSDFILNFKVVLPCYNNSWSFNCSPLSLGSFRRTRRATKEQNLMDFPTSEYNGRKINVQKCTFNSSIPLYPHPMGACYYLKVPFNGQISYKGISSRYNFILTMYQMECFLCLGIIDELLTSKQVLCICGLSYVNMCFLNDPFLHLISIMVWLD